MIPRFMPLPLRLLPNPIRKSRGRALGMAVVLASLGAGLSRLAAQPADPSAANPASRTLLFVDDHDILYRSGTHRVFHPMRRHASNPVIPSGERPWETRLAWTSIHRNPATGLYQIWYQSSNGDRSADRTRRCVVCYAESMDGIRFTKPDLGL